MEDVLLSKAEWGTKRVCPSCATKYYDLQRTPIVCPRCGAAFDPDAVLRSRRTRTTTAERPAQAPAAIRPPSEANEEGEDLADDDEELDEEFSDDGDDSLIEDTSELGEDDDVSDVVASSDDEEES